MRNSALDSPFDRLVANTTYLVESTADYTWAIKRRPAGPRTAWHIDGLTFIGFPTSPVNHPNFKKFLTEAPALQSLNVVVYRYAGPDLGTNNPIQIRSTLFSRTSVQRGQAFWMRSGTEFNRYSVNLNRQTRREVKKD